MATEQTRPYSHGPSRWPMLACSLPATLARHLGLREPSTITLTSAERRDGRTLGTRCGRWSLPRWRRDCIDDADALRAGGTVGVLGCVVTHPPWGPQALPHVRQLDRVSRQLLARAWAAGAGPGDSDHRPGRSGDLWEGGSAPPRLYITRCWRRRHRRGAGPAARGPGQHRHFAWGGSPTAGPGDNSRCGPTAASTPTLSLPPAAASLSPSASAPACGT